LVPTDTLREIRRVLQNYLVVDLAYTADEIALKFNYAPETVRSELNKMVWLGKVEARKRNNEVYFRKLGSLTELYNWFLISKMKGDLVGAVFARSEIFEALRTGRFKSHGGLFDELIKPI